MNAELRVDPFPSDGELNALMSASWNHAHSPVAYSKILDRSLTHVGAYHEGRLLGFVNVAWDGSAHAFILDTCVHPEFRRQGVATGLVKAARSTAAARGAKWLHVDFEPHLAEFYAKCGFRPTQAGLIKLTK